MEIEEYKNELEKYRDTKYLETAILNIENMIETDKGGSNK
jgi:hypothetical protein